MPDIKKYITLMVKVSKSNKHILDPIQKEIDELLIKDLGVNFKSMSDKNIEDIIKEKLNESYENNSIGS